MSLWFYGLPCAPVANESHAYMLPQRGNNKKNESWGDEHCLRFSAIVHRSCKSRSLFAAEENETDMINCIHTTPTSQSKIFYS